MKIRKFVVMATYQGIFDDWTEEWTGIEHETREAARSELIRAKNDTNIEKYVFTIKEVLR